MDSQTYSKDAELLVHLKKLKKNYIKKAGSKEWTEHLSITKGEISLNSEDLEKDFDRELKFYENTLNNSTTMVNKLLENNIPVWRPSDYKAETLKNDQHMARIQKNLEDLKKKFEVVEKRKQAKSNKKFGNEAHKRHVRSKQLKKSEEKSKKLKYDKKKSFKAHKKQKIKRN